MRAFLRVLAVFAVLGLGLGAGRWIFKPAASEGKTSRLSVSGHPHLPVAPPPPNVSFSPAAHDFGDIFEGESRACRLEVERPAGSVLRLGRLSTSCACVSLSAEKLQFPANEPASLSVGLHSLTLEGKKTFTVYAEVLDPSKGTLCAELSVNVKRVPAKIALVPEAFHCGGVRGAKNVSATLFNLTNRPLALGAPFCSLAGAKTQLSHPSPVAPGRSVTIALTLPASGLKPGPIEGHVALETDCPEHAQMLVPLDGTVLPEK